MGGQPVRIQEPFGSCVVSGEKVTVTPPHGFLSSRDYVFDRSREVATVADRRLGIFSSKKNIEFQHISFGIAQGVGEIYCLEMFSRVPNRPLVVYELTSHCDALESLEPMKKAIAEGTGINRWQEPTKN